MFGKIILLLSLIFVLISCAQPKYVQENKAGSDFEDGQQKMSCDTRFKTSGYCVAWAWEQKPLARERGSFIFKVYRASLLDGSAVMVDLPITPEVILWMPSMGHGSTAVKVERVDIGGYRASEVLFVMPGEWEIKFQVKEGSSIQDEAVVALTI